MANGNQSTKLKAGDCIIFLIILSHFLIIFVDGRRVQFLKNKELLMQEGTVKTIESEDGDVIDCVDIYKQPAFNHPLLKNHTIQMEPSMHLREIESENNSNIFSQNWLKNGECPDETIPIIRTQASVFQRKQIKNSVDFDTAPGHEYAQVTLVGGNYYGAQAVINVWNPITSKDEFSLAQIWVLSGQEKELNSMEAGWIVSSGENQTRLFIFWTSDGYQSTGCYNLLCPGFVQVNKKIAFGSAIAPVSSYGEKQYDIAIIIRKDRQTGNWWLQVQNQLLGYWPGSIFTSLAESSTAINWGGEITNNMVEGQHTQTFMGSGHFSDEGFGKASYFWKLGYFDDSGTLRGPGSLTPFATNPSCYDILIADNRDHGVSFYYGGSGFSSQCP